jgi:quinolinate synthase
VVSYVNTTAAVKALTDVVVTSGNAKKVIDSFPQDAKLIFGPDYNLGNYINLVTGRQMLLWQGGCHVHERFSVEAIVKLKAEHPEALVMAHLECKSPVLALADVKGSTADMLKYAQAHPSEKYIVATESGILHEMQRSCPETTFIPVPPEVTEGEIATESQHTELTESQHTELTESQQTELTKSQQTGRVTSCGCNECEYMKKNTLLKIYNALKYEWPAVEVDSAIARDAVKPIERMLELS